MDSPRKNLCAFAGLDFFCGERRKGRMRIPKSLIPKPVAKSEPPREESPEPQEESPDASPPDHLVDRYLSYKLADLRRMAKARGLSDKGAKLDLAKALAQIETPAEAEKRYAAMPHKELVALAKEMGVRTSGRSAAQIAARLIDV